MRGTSNGAAYEAFLEGKYGFHLSSSEALAESRRCFARAADLDPGFARAWSALSYTYVQDFLQGWGDARALEAAGSLARRGVELDPNDYFTRWHLAFYLLNVKQFDLAIAEYEAALALSDESQDLLVEMAEALICAGRLDLGIELIERARHTADWGRWDSAWHRCLSARGKPNGYDEALVELSRLHRKPGDPRGLIDVQLLAAAMRAASGATAPHPNGGANGHARPVNGHKHVNGAALNGTRVNGTGPDESHLNGVHVNGTAVNGTAMNGAVARKPKPHAAPLEAERAGR